MVMDKFLNLSPKEQQQVINLMAESAPDTIQQLANELTAITGKNGKPVKGLGYITAIEILLKIGRYGLDE